MAFSISDTPVIFNRTVVISRGLIMVHHPDVARVIRKMPHQTKLSPK
jgi:hypothetical protein